MTLSLTETKNKMTSKQQKLIRHLLESANPLNTIDDLGPLLDRTQNTSHVLLGEATHGTKEFYDWRAEISKRLIVEQDFKFVAVEGDWPDCYKINQYVKGYLDPNLTARDTLHLFNRWPTWMWANEEMVSFIEWLKEYNSDQKQEDRVGFYGLDVYSLWQSLQAVIDYLKQVDPAAVETARQVYRCFEPFGQNADQYALAAAYIPTSCENEVIKMLAKVRRDIPEYSSTEWEATFNADQNALVVANAEMYYRTLLKGDVESWNLRDYHMAETCKRLMDFHGPASRGLVWAHNSHVGDARYSDMVRQGIINLGQIVRGQEPDGKVALVGFGTYEGEVLAARRWEGKMEKMMLASAKKDSWEDIMHQTNLGNALWFFDPLTSPDELLESRSHRAVGVVYHPESEAGNYVETTLPGWYDVFIHIDKTSALHPLHPKEAQEKEPPETYPSGV